MKRYLFLLLALAPLACAPAVPIGATAPGPPVVGGKTSPDGKVEIALDLPDSLRKRNASGRDGLGLCVFTSVEYAAHWQNVRALEDLQAHMKQEPGGGWPEKVDAVLARHAPGVRYVQHTGGDAEFLRAATKTGRMAAITYGGSAPHYGDRLIYHMVVLVCYDEASGWACVCDNNFPNEFVWMSCPELLRRWRMTRGGGWAIVLLSPSPSPVPRR